MVLQNCSAEVFSGIGYGNEGNLNTDGKRRNRKTGKRDGNLNNCTGSSNEG